MASDKLIKILLGFLLVVTAASAFLVVRYNLTYRKLRQQQGQLMMANNMRAQMNQFVGTLGVELLEYSKSNPAIDPLLRQYGFKQNRTNTAPVVPPQR
jgi:hypothetical protein